MSDFPLSIFQPRIVENKPAVVYNPDKTTHFYAEDVNFANAEIVLIEEFLSDHSKIELYSNSVLPIFAIYDYDPERDPTKIKMFQIIAVPQDDVVYFDAGRDSDHKGKIYFRSSQNGEVFATLDGTENTFVLGDQAAGKRGIYYGHTMMLEDPGDPTADPPVPSTGNILKVVGGLYPAFKYLDSNQDVIANVLCVIGDPAEFVFESGKDNDHRGLTKFRNFVNGDDIFIVDGRDDTIYSKTKFDSNILKVKQINNDFVDNVIVDDFCTIDWTLGINQQITLNEINGNTPTIYFTLPTSGCKLLLRIIQNSTGNQNPNIPTMAYAGGDVYVPTQTPNAVDYLTIIYDGSRLDCFKGLDMR